MEVLDLNWTRLVLDGPPRDLLLAWFALPFLGIPILVVTIGAVVLDFISVRQGVAIIVAALVIWFLTILSLG